VKRNLCLMFVFVLLLFFGPVAARSSLAGGPTWQPLSGPQGGSVAALALSPNYSIDHTVFAGLRGQGVYRTSDGGDSWQRVGPSGWVVVGLAISPDYGVDGTLFAATGLPTTGFHIYRSTDEGDSWQEVTPVWSSPPNTPRLAVSPDYGADRTVCVLGGLQTYVSTDGGDSFDQAGGWFVTRHVVHLAFSPDYGADRTLFALVRGEGLYRSTDGGATWSPTGLSGDLSTFAVSPAYPDDGTLIAASRSSGLLYLSTDGGDTWAPPEVVLGTGGQHTLLFSPSFVTDRIILAASSADPGPYRTADGGTNWSPVGWYDPDRPYAGSFVGGSVFALALAPHTAYDAAGFAGTSGGIYRSHDWGEHWSQRISSPAPLTVRALAVAPGDPSTLLAGTSFFETRIDGQPDEHDGNLQRSTDGGQTWRAVSGRLARVRGVALSPGFATDRTAFAATGTPGEHGLADGGVYRSTDGGLNWTGVLSGTMVEALALSPDFPQDRTLWAATFTDASNLGVRVSTDGGDTWAFLTWSLHARVLVPSPNYGVDRTLFAGTEDRGLQRSTDSGVSWTEVLSQPVTALAVSPAYGASRTVYAGVKEGPGIPGQIYRSTDGGQTWRQLEPGIPPTWRDESVTISVLAFAADGSVLAGVSYGGAAGGAAVYRSVDGGGTWQPVGSGLSAQSLFALATAPSRSLSFYAGTDGRLWGIEVPQGGPAEPGTWESSGPRGGRPQTLALSPEFASDGVAFAGAWFYSAAGGKSGLGILKSTDGGQTWRSSGSGAEGIAYSSAVHAYAFSPDFATDRTVFVGTWGGLFKSTDGGESWHWLTRLYSGPPGSVTTVAVAPDYAESGHVLAGRGWDSVCLSRDGGKNWTENTGVTAGSAIVYSPDFASDGVAFAGGYEGLYKMADGGTRWTRVLTRPLAALAVSPRFGADGRLFAGGDGLYVSTDGGTSWISTTVGADSSHVKALAVSPAFADDRTLFAGTTSGLYRSGDGGASWEPVASYPGLPVLSLAISPDWPGHPFLLVGTDLGVYRTTDGGASWARVQGLATLSTWPIAFSPSGNLLLTGARNHGVYGSTDTGASWLPMGLQAGGWHYNIPDVAISPVYASDGTLFAAWDSVFSIGGTIYRTTDGGTTWEQIYSTDYVGALAISPQYADDQTVYAAGNSGRILRSTDGGQTWDAVGNWPSGAYAGATRVALPPNYPEDGTVFAGGQGVWRLPPGATEWELAAGLDSSYYVRSIAVSPDYAGDQTLLATASWSVEPAGSQRHAVFRSTDGGAHWELADAGLPEGEQMRDVAFSPRYGTDRTAYVTSDRQLYRSLDGGQSWTGVGGPPESPDLYDLAVDSAGDVHVASSAGVWRYTTPAQDVIVDGGFEAGGGWTMPATVRPASYSDRVAYQGLRSVRVGIVNGGNAYTYSSARQAVTIPTDTITATLSFYTYRVSGESTTAAQDRVFRMGSASDPWHTSPSRAAAGDAQYVLIIDPDSGAILETLLWDLSNGQRWQHHAFDLRQYAGETVLIHFGVYNDGGGGRTGMYVDNVALVVSRLAVGGSMETYLPLVLRNRR
jgi:photosystem II stability/assembly factor-like uncharacterized protein